MKRLLLALLLVCITTAALFAKGAGIPQDSLIMYIECPEQVVVGDKFNVEYKMLCPDGISEDNLNCNLTTKSEVASLLINFPSVTVSHSTTLTNGKLTEFTTKSWTYIFRANKTGTFKTPDFIVSDGNDTLRIPSANRLIEITKEGAGTVNDSGNKQDTVKTQLITRLELDKNTVQLGDSLVLKVVLLSNCNISNFNYINFPMIEDCYLEELAESVSGPSVVTIDQSNYYKWIIREYLVIPLKKGTFNIEPLRFKGEKLVYEFPEDNIWGAFSKINNVPFEVVSNSISFNVE